MHKTFEKSKKSKQSHRHFQKAPSTKKNHPIFSAKINIVCIDNFQVENINFIATYDFDRHRIIQASYIIDKIKSSTG